MDRLARVGATVDFHGRVHRGVAKVLAHELDALKRMVIEELVLSENFEAPRDIVAHTSTPTTLGERLHTGRTSPPERHLAGRSRTGRPDAGQAALRCGRPPAGSGVERRTR